MAKRTTQVYRQFYWAYTCSDPALPCYKNCVPVGFMAALIVSDLIAAPGPHPDAKTASLDANPFPTDATGLSLVAPFATTTLADMELNGVAVLHYLLRPIVVTTDDSQRSLVAHRFQLDTGAAVGLLGIADVGLVIPIVIDQLARYPGKKMGQTARFGLGNMQVRPRVELISETWAPLGVALQATAFLPSGNPDAYMSFGGAGIEPQLVISRRVHQVTLAASAGYRAQPQTRIFNLIDDDKITAALGASFRGLPLDVDAMCLLHTDARRPFHNARHVGGEALVAGAWTASPELRLFAGGSAGLFDAVPTPVFRAFIGAHFHSDSYVDSDGDGLANHEDTCPSVPEDVDKFEDDDGCPDPDNDQDGAPDPADRCPNAAEDRDGFDDDDGCPDHDNDGDGVTDVNDHCPSEPEDLDGFNDHDGCPDTDNDDDGIVDTNDSCPNEPEIINEVADSDGCPDSGEELVVRTNDAIQIRDAIHFAPNSQEILPRSHGLLRQVANLLTNHARIRRLRIEGHTDSFGGPARNLELSQRRAESVREFLVRAGIGAERLEAVGFGETQPLTSNVRGRGRGHNRRVEFVIVQQAP